MAIWWVPSGGRELVKLEMPPRTPKQPERLIREGSMSSRNYGEKQKLENLETTEWSASLSGTPLRLYSSLKFLLSLGDRFRFCRSETHTGGWAGKALFQRQEYKIANTKF